MDERHERMVHSVRRNMQGTDLNSLATVESAEIMERHIAALLTGPQLESAALAILELCGQTSSMVNSQPCSAEQLHAMMTVSNVHATAAVLLLDRRAEQLATEPICTCGHHRSHHIYESGACRPGHRCAAECTSFEATS